MPVEIMRGHDVPPELADSVRISWMLSYWCNYKCNYCGVPVFSRRTKARKEHAFDHYAACEWVSAFRRIRARRVLLRIAGGEPFIDSANWKQFVSGLMADRRFELEIVTNASWNADHYRDLPDPRRIRLAVSFHPSQTSFTKWRERVLHIRAAGFTVTRAILVLAPENLDCADAFRDQMERDEILWTFTPMLAAGLYIHKKRMSDRASMLTREGVTPAVAWMKVIRHNTKGQLCFYPALSYDLEYDGRIRVACLEQGYTNFIRDSLPALPRSAVFCPTAACPGCMEMIYSMPANPFVKEPARLFDEVTLAAETRAWRQSVSDNPNHWRETLGSVNVPGSDIDCYTGFVRLQEETTSLPPVTAHSALLETEASQQIPDVPFLGYLDNHCPHVPWKVRLDERIMLSGWAFKTRPLKPASRVRLSIAGRIIAVFEDFYARPEVAKLFGRPEVLEVGFQGWVHLPLAIRAGQYQIEAFAADEAGQEYPLPPQPVQVVE